MKLIEVLLKICLTLLLPTPKKIRELLAMLNTAIAGRTEDGTPKFTQDQWDEIRRARDAKKK